MSIALCHLYWIMSFHGLMDLFSSPVQAPGTYGWDRVTQSWPVLVQGCPLLSAWPNSLASSGARCWSFEKHSLSEKGLYWGCQGLCSWLALLKPPGRVNFPEGRGSAPAYDHLVLCPLLWGHLASCNIYPCITSGGHKTKKAPDPTVARGNRALRSPLSPSDGSGSRLTFTWKNHKREPSLRERSVHWDKAGIEKKLHALEACGMYLWKEGREERERESFPVSASYFLSGFQDTEVDPEGNNFSHCLQMFTLHSPAFSGLSSQVEEDADAGCRHFGQGWPLQGSGEGGANVFSWRSLSLNSPLT